MTAQDQIAAGTGMDAVTLHVADLDRMTAYYRDAVALTVLDDAAPTSHGLLPHAAAGTDAGGVVTLGRGTVPLVVLRHTPDLPPAVRGSAGLFHTAILFDDEPTLAAAVASVAQRAPGTYVGSADHLVSEAFYFTDPEGNGVELYHDRGREEWGYDDGRIRMDSLRLDPNEFLRAHLTDTGIEDPSSAGGAVVGHVHLQVGDVPAARTFYVDALGFDVMAEWHGALFVSAGGYHHHLAMNTWHSRGAGPRASSLGLGEVSIRVPEADDLGALVARLHHHGVPVADDGATVTFEDPWRNLVRVGVGAPPS